MKQLFILNPVAGTGRDPVIYENAVKQVFGQDARIVRTERRGHGRELARQAVQDGVERVTAIGGDGTINEIAQALTGTPAVFGIIPKGSGNGFAREFGIPLDPLKACETLAQSVPLSIDVGRINGEPFFNVAGFGLDAQIAFVFEKTQKGGRRGQWPYFRLGLREYRRYTPEPVTLRHEGGETKATPLLVAIANCKQYGSGAKIAPQAIVNDGLLHLAIVENVPWYRLLPVLPKIFTGAFTHAPFLKTILTRTLSVAFPRETPYHLDGEVRSAAHITADILPRALTLQVPRSYHP